MPFLEAYISLLNDSLDSKLYTWQDRTKSSDDQVILISADVSISGLQNGVLIISHM